MAQHDLSPAALEFMLAGLQAHLETGTGLAKIEVYNDPKPSIGDPVTTQTKLFEFTLADPVGTITGTELDIDATGPAMVMNSGTPTWARWKNQNGDWHADSDAGGPLSTAAVKVSTTTVTAGGEVSLVSATVQF